MSLNVSFEKSLAGRNPELAKEWDFERNFPTTPETVSAGTPSKYFWLCPVGHSYETSCAKRRAGRNCPYCSNQLILPGFNDLETKFPEVAKTWDQDRNSMKPNQVAPSSGQKYFWRCPQGHSYESSISNRTHGTGCPFCAGKKVLKGFNDLASKRPDVAREWHPTKNTLRPDEVTSRSGRTVWWLCVEGHEYSGPIDGRTRAEGARGCPFCSGQKVLTGFNDLQTVSPDLSKEWDYDANELRPTEVAKSARARIGWICPNGHKYFSVVYARLAGNGCPICDNKQVLKGFNDFATAHPELLLEWDFLRNEDMRPDSIIAQGGRKKIWWICPSCGSSFDSTIAHRLQGTGCPSCANYGFNPSLKSVLYFLENSDLLARKIGVTNLSERRVQRFERFGAAWKLVFLVEGSGAVVLRLEREVFRWLRNELGLGIALSKTEMGSSRGATETFPIGGVSNEEIIAWIKLRFQELE